MRQIAAQPEYNKETKLWDFYLRRESPEFLMVIISTIISAGLGYMFLAFQGIILGMVAGTLVPMVALSYFQPNIRPYRISLPETAIPGAMSIAAMGPGIHYFVCYNYDENGQPQGTESDDMSMAVAENIAMETQSGLKDERIQNLEAQLGELQTTYEEQMGKQIDLQERLARASRPYVSQKPQQTFPYPEWAQPKEESQ